MLTYFLCSGSYPSILNTSAVSMMLSLNIAELIPDHGNMLRKLDARDLMGDFQCGSHPSWNSFQI